MAIEPGTLLGRYQVLALIGAGGMGEVYRAKDTQLGRDVAVKILPRSLMQEPERKARFEQEARAASALNHPNIVAVYDIGEQGGIVYVVSELLEGINLRDKMAVGTIPIRKAIDYGLQIARGLAAAHDKGIIHRDLKPENIYIVGDGMVKILDFGLAKLARPNVAGQDSNATSAPTMAFQTHPGMVMGTAGYMSPEQVRGQEVDARCDIFSLGILLHEMLGSEHAFRRESSVETMSAILREEPAELPPTIPPELQRLVQHCLEKDPQMRFHSARDLAFALDSLSGSSGSKPQFAPVPRRKPLRPRMLIAGAFTLGVITGAGLGYWLFATQPAEAPLFRYLTYSGHDTSPAGSPDGKTVAFSSSRDGSQRIWIKELAGGGEAPLTSGPDDSPRFSPDGSMVLFSRNEGEHTSLYRMRTVAGEPLKVIEDVGDGDWSPRGDEITYTQVRTKGAQTISVIGIVSTEGGPPREIAQFENEVLQHPRWSPDGKWIAATGGTNPGINQAIFVAPARGNGPSQTMRPPPGPNFMSSADWSPDSQELIYFQSETTLGGSGAPSGVARIIRQRIGSGKVRVISFSQQSAQVIDFINPNRIVFDTVSEREGLQEMSLKAGTSNWLTQGNSSDRQPVYTPDGRHIIFTSNRSGNLDLWQISTGNGEIRRLTDDKGDDEDPGLSPDGSKLVWTSNRKGHFEIYIARRDGSGARQLTDDGVDAENATMTRDGAWVVYTSYNPQKVGLWKIRQDGAGATRLVQGLVNFPEVCPSGDFALYSIGNQKTHSLIRFLHVADAAPVAFEIDVEIRNPSTAASVGRARWMPDGQSIAFVGQNEKGMTGIYVQKFAPGVDTRATRRPLGGFDMHSSAESFGISQDGSRLAVANWEQTFSIMLAEHLSGLSRARGVQ